MTNFGALAILALERKRRSKVLSPDEADLRLLLALETFPDVGNGRRSVGMKKLAEAAGVPYATARRSRDRLIAEGLVACVMGAGRGNLTTWRFLFPLKVLSQGEHLSVDNDADPTQERCSPAPGKSAPASEKVLTSPAKGAHQNESTRENAGSALVASDLGSSLRSPAADTIRAAVSDVTDDEIEAFIAKITPKCRTGDVARFLGGFPADNIAAQITAMRSERKQAKRKADKAEIGKFLAWARKQPECGHGVNGGDQIRPDDVAVCPQCRRASSATTTNRS